MSNGNPNAWQQQEKEYLEREKAKALPAMLLVAVGLTLCLCGGLILFTQTTGRTQGASGGPLVVLAIGTVLFGAGLAWLIPLRQRMTYRITRRFSPALAGVTLVLLVLAVAAPLGLAALLDNVNIRFVAGPLLIALVPAVISMYVRFNSALLMNPVAVTVGWSGVPWPAVAQIVVTPLGADRGVEIGLRLRPDVPLPPNTELPEPAPGDPAAPQARVEITTRKFNQAKFLEAVARFGLPGIPVVERTPAGERVISR